MASQDRVHAVQQDIQGVVGRVSELEALLERKGQAGNKEEVKFLQRRLEKLDDQVVSLRRESANLREHGNLLLRAQGGRHSVLCHVLPPSYLTELRM